MPLNPIPTWLAALERDPRAAVADLFAGRIDLGRFARLDYAEFLSRALAEPGAGPELQERLDQGLAAWLAAWQADDEVLRRRLGVQAYLYRLNEALAGIVLLNLPISARQLRDQQLLYQHWLKRYDYGFGDGPYAGYWRALAATQTDLRFQRQWHDFVVRAEERYPRYALNIGLTGLRRLDLPSDQRLLRLLNALLRRAWRIGTAAAAAEFAKRLSALAADMPMANDGWRGRVLRLLEILEQEEKAHKHPLQRLHAFQANLTKALEPLIGDIGLGRATAQSIRVPDLPGAEERLRIAQELRELQPMAIQHALELFEGHRAYAEASGDAYFFVRTLCNLGHRVLKQPGLDTQTLESLRGLLRHALAWEPGNPYPWSFWAELEQAGAREDVAETVLWEAVRRFPDNEPSRVELALLLQRRHANEHAPALLVEAEQLLREVVNGNPRHEPSRVELALLLQRRHAREHTPALLAEAEQLLREVVNANPRDSHSRTELGRLLARNGRKEAAQDLLREGLAARADPFWRRMLADIEAGKPLPLPKLDIKQPKRARASAAPVTDDLEALRANAAAARFAYARERGEAGNPASLAAGQYDLPRFYLGWFGQAPVEAAPEGTRPPYALAALAALAEPRRWAEVESNYPAYARDTVLLKLYAGIPVPGEARAELAHWLEEPEAADEAEADDDVPESGKMASYDDFLRRRLRKLDFLNASEQTPGGLATTTRAGDIDRLIERNLARTIEADIPPLALAA